MSESNHEAVANERYRFIQGVLIEIREQTTKTNGSVARVKESMAFWRGAIWAIGAFMVFVVLPVLGYALYQIVQIPDLVHTAVQDTFNNYNVTRSQ